MRTSREKRLGATLSARLAHLKDRKRGSILSWTALSIVGMVGMAAISIDLGYVYVTKAQLQGTADSAASAAARELPNAGNVLAAAQDVATKNMPASARGAVMSNADVVIGNWNSGTRTFTAASAGGTPTNAVRVTARRDNTNSNPVATFFGKALGIETVELNAEAIALQGEGQGPGCLISLDPSSDVAFTMDSNARIDVTGCAVYVNSNHASALTLRSNSNMRADDIYVAGGYDLFSNAWTNPSPPETGEIPIADPLGNLPTPTQDHHLHPITSTPASGLAQGCDFTNRTLNSNQSATLNPGIYCGGIWLASNSGVILNPGFYVMKPSLTRPGALHMDSNTTLQGAGVLFYLTGAGSIVDLNSNSSVDISAPTSATALTYPVLAPYVGVVIFQDRALSGLVNRLNSNKRYFGAVYMPNNDILVDSNGSISANSLCTIFIARRYHFDSNATFTGNYNISQNCPALIANAVTGGGGGTVSTKLLR